MNRTEYFQKQKELSKAAARAEVEAARRIRAATRELVLPLVKQYAEQGTIIYPTEELARQIDHIIREEGAKPVMAARKLQEDMEASLAEKLGIAPRSRQENRNAKQKNAPKKTKYSDDDWKKKYDLYKAGVISPVQWRLFEKEYHDERPAGTGRQSYMPETYHGKGWGYGVPDNKPIGEIINMGGTLSGYYRDPQTGKIVWTDLPLEYQFRKRADLSTRVWKTVEEQEQKVFDVIRGGRAAGRNVKDICGDLEQYINYSDGGKRVVGRWMGMFPNTEAGRKEAWQREYLAAHGGLQPGSDDAKALLRQPDAQAWVQQKMAETTKRGTPRLPAAVKQYASRLGKAGLDYRAISLARTETTAMLADEQLAIAGNSSICTGEMDFVMERGRDAWPCNCEKYAAQNPWKVDDPERPEIPVHPNCVCSWRPRLKTDAEIMASLKAEMKDDLEAIQGTDEQRDFLEQIDKAEEAINKEIAERTEKVAIQKHSDEKWVDASAIKLETEGLIMPKNLDGITIANSRLTGEKGDEKTLLREIKQAKTVTINGDSVYLLPKLKNENGEEIKGPDAVWNGKIYEFKTVDGSIGKVESNFRDSRKQCENVYIKISDKNITKDEVLRKIRGVLNDSTYKGGTDGTLSLYLENDKRIHHFNIRRLKPKW